MAHVCILYAVENQAFATRIEEALSALGYGVSRREVVEESCFAYGDGADEPEAMIVIWSTSSISSPAVIAEARAALARRALTPVAIGKVEPPPSFQHLWPIELSGWTGALEDPRWRFVVDEINLSVRRAEIGFEDVDRRFAGAAGERDQSRYSGRSVIMGAALSLTVLALGAIVFAPYIIGGREERLADALGAPVRRIAPDEATKPALAEKIENDVFAPNGANSKAIAATLRADPPAVDSPQQNASSEQNDDAPRAPLQQPVLPALEPDQTEPANLLESARGLEKGKAEKTAAISQNGAMPKINAPDAPAPLGASPQETANSAQSTASGPLQEAAQGEDDLSLGALEQALLDEDVSRVEEIEEGVASIESVASGTGTGTGETLEDAAPALGLPVGVAIAADAAGATDEAGAADESGAIELAIAADQLDPDKVADSADQPAVAANDLDTVDQGDVPPQSLAAHQPQSDQDPQSEQEVLSANARYFRDCDDCPEMVEVPGGVFSMGTPVSEPVRDAAELAPRDISMNARYALGAREVTYAQWDACVAAGACNKAAATDPGWGRGARPVVNISWDDAQDYVRWLSAKSGQTYRLPTETEWEYAARAGTTTPFSFGYAVTSDLANFNGTYKYGGPVSAYRRRTTPVGSFSANAFGLFDMHGNVWEWTSDCWPTNDQANSEAGNESGGGCDKRVLKGGAWNSGGWRLRAGHRISGRQAYRDYDNGFRVARSLP